MSYSAAGGFLIGAMLFYSAVGVALGDPPSEAVPSAQHEQTGNKPDRPEPPRPATATASEQPEEPAYTAEYQRACEQPETPEEANLCQQWRIAEASEELVNITELQLWWNIIGASALVLTLIVTACATVAAARAASSSVEANRLIRIDQRPWLTVEPAIEGDLVFHKTAPVGNVRITVRNVGKTPAKNITVDVKLLATGDRFLDKEIIYYASLFLLTKNRDIINAHGNTLFPGEHFSVVRDVVVGPDVVEKQTSTLLDARPSIALSLIVCVLYQFEFHEQEYEPVTAVSYRLIKVGSPRMADFFYLDDKVVSADKIRFEASYGSFIR